MPSSHVGVGSYYILSHLEDQAQRDQYDAITGKIRFSTMTAMNNRIDALSSCATAVRQSCPEEKDWPYCGLSFYFFQSMLSPLHRITQTRTIGYCPSFHPADVPNFEAFAKRYYTNQGFPQLYGQRIFSVTHEKYHDIHGNSSVGEYKMVFPVLQATDIQYNSAVFLYNLYSNPSRASAIDYAYNCVNIQHRQPSNCSANSGIINLVQDYPELRPSTLTSLPIVPMDSPNVVGIVYAVQHWDTVLNLGYNDKVDGVMVVISDSIITHSFMYKKGQAIHISDNDAHDESYNDQEVSFLAIDHGPHQYTVKLYPTQEWMDQYIDEWPIIFCVVMVALVAFTASVFCFYDFIVNRDAVHQDLIMQTKRQYVRYISHEIRTPLNVVNLGFQVLFSEMKRLYDFLLQKSKPASAKDDISTKSTETRSLQWERNELVPSNSANTEHDNISKQYNDSDRSNPSYSSEDVMIRNLLDWIELVQDIVDSANTAIAVLNDLIDYDKIDTGTMSLQKEPLNLQSIIESTVHQFSVQARAKSIQIQLCGGFQQQEAEKIVIEGDRVKLSQVLRNLLSNALKFTPQGGKMTINCKWEEDQVNSKNNKSLTEVIVHGKMVVTVTDSGAGMSSEQIQQLFREGVQFTPNDLQAGQGSGLGLWIAKGIVDSHGGHLNAFSEGENRGTTFTFILPAYATNVKGPETVVRNQTSPWNVIGEEEKVNRSSSLDELPDIHESERQVSCTIDDIDELHSIDLLLESKQCRHFHNLLVTDDSAVNRKMMCRSLESMGFKCFQACDGQECLDIVEKALNNEHASIDLILMDFEMPRMNGPTATAAIRNLGCDIPVVGVTGNVLNEDKKLFMEHGAVKVLQKPFAMAELEDVLNKLTYSSQFVPNK